MPVPVAVAGATGFEALFVDAFEGVVFGAPIVPDLVVRIALVFGDIDSLAVFAPFSCIPESAFRCKCRKPVTAMTALSVLQWDAMLERGCQSPTSWL